MIDLSIFKNKYDAKAFEQSYKSSGREDWDKEEVGKFAINLPELNAGLNVEILDGMYPNSFEKETTYEKYTNISIRVDDISYNRSLKAANFNYDINKLTEVVVAYAYAVKNLNAHMLEGKTKKELKEMSTEDLQQILDSKRECLTNMEQLICDVAMNKPVEKTGQQMLNDFIGKGKVNVDALVRSNVIKTLMVKEKQTSHELKVQAMKDGFAKLLSPVKNLGDSIRMRNEMRGKLKAEKMQEKQARKEEEQKRQEILDELVIS